MVDPLSTAAIGWSFSAAGWLISPILSRFLNQCFDALGINLPTKFQSRKKILFEKLEKLQTIILPQLLILTDAAHQSPHRHLLENWLKKLKSAFYEAEHVLGLVEYEQLEKKVNSLFPSTSRSKLNLKNLKGKLPKFSSQKKNLISSLENLETIVNEAMDFVLLLGLSSSSSVNNFNWRPNEQYRETISTTGSTVIGRDKDRDHIVKLLRENRTESTSNAKCYSVIGLWGMGGSGKTTLAQYVCEHEKEAKYFDCILWAHVSENFNVHAILKKILESASKEACPDFSSLEGLQSKLEEKLRGQMFFLVLDDVWCNKRVGEQEFEKLFAPLRAAKRGSKILVTTRIEEAAKALGDMNPIPLRELDDEQFFSLFMINALGDVHIRDNRLNEKVTLIGKDIAIKLFRSPLAAKAVAGQLRRRLDPDFWKYMLESSLLNDAMGALFLSYRHLPPSLQRCFAFCSLFPKGHNFSQDDLVDLWIAEGFVESGNSKEHMKDIANRYISELISNSFLQVLEIEIIKKYRIYRNYYLHDLMHDLAQYVSEGEFFRVERGEEKEIPAHTRHIFVMDDMLGGYLDEICKFKDLRTVIVSRSFYDFDLKEVNLDSLFSELRKLCVLELEGIDFKRVHKSVVQLKNLRYLKFEKVKEDANFNLLNRLYQLRVLYTNSQMPSHVGRLISLRHCPKFYVRAGVGFELKQLEHLKDLHGSLTIHGLDDVNNKEEAEQAKLSEKKNLHKLHYQWNTESGHILRENDAQILDGLCPPSQIRDLVIEGYSGRRFPSWIVENSNSIIYLEYLQLANCQFLETLPKINVRSNFLSLRLCYLPRLKSLEPPPWNLTQLRLYDCFSLSFVLNEDLEKIMASRSMRISRLVTFMESCHGGKHGSLISQSFCVQEMMKIGNCVDEQALLMISKDTKYCIEKRLDLICQLTNVHGELYLPPALEELTIRSCCITDKVLAVSLQNLNSLTNINLENILTMTCITDEVLSSLTSLMVLIIRDCLFLTSIGGWDTHNALKELLIQQCPSLILNKSVAGNSRDTENLTPSSYSKKTSVLKDVSLQVCTPTDDVFQNLVSIETITVMDCPTIVNLQFGYLEALVFLKLDDCPNLISMRSLSKLNVLKQLSITSCQKIQSYSDTDKLPQLKELSICKLSQLEQLISIDGLSSLVTLQLLDAQEEYFSQQECEVLIYLSSLETICFRNCQMRSLPDLQCIHSLRYLEIRFCPNLTSLSELPRSIQGLTLFYCNEEFTRSCKDTNDPNWHKIFYIPNKCIQP